MSLSITSSSGPQSLSHRLGDKGPRPLNSFLPPLSVLSRSLGVAAIEGRLHHIFLNASARCNFRSASFPRVF